MNEVDYQGMNGTDLTIYPPGGISKRKTLEVQTTKSYTEIMVLFSLGDDKYRLWFKFQTKRYP